MLPIHQGKQQTNETTMNPEQPTPTPEPQTHGSPSDFKYHQTPTQRVEQQINDWHQSITPWCGLFLEAIDELRKVASELEQLQTSGVKDFNCDYKVMAQQKSAELERVQAALKCSSIMYVESCKERDDLRRQVEQRKPTYCLGQHAIEQLAIHSQLETETVYFIAASDLYQKNPYAEIVELRRQVEELKSEFGSLKISCAQSLDYANQLRADNAELRKDKERLVGSLQDICCEIRHYMALNVGHSQFCDCSFCFEISKAEKAIRQAVDAAKGK
jgi:hypothetical protein